MDPHMRAALLLAAAINAVIPGPGMVLAIARAASDGLAAGVKVTLGMILATLVVMCAVWAVFFGLIHLSDSALKVLRVVGVIALALIALSLLKPVPHQTTARAPIPTRIPLRRRVLRLAQMGDLTGGLLTGLTSPVHLLFMLALVPQFVDMTRATPALLALITRGHPSHHRHTDGLGQPDRCPVGSFRPALDARRAAGRRAVASGIHRARAYRLPALNGGFS